MAEIERGNPAVERARQATLEEDIFAALARACREGDPQVAELLLQALEAIARRDRDASPLNQGQRPDGGPR